MSEFRYVFLGDVPSKSNSYGTTRMGGFYKKKELKEYEKSFRGQILEARLLGGFVHIDGEFALRCIVYFREKRKDLDNAFKIILDCLQAGGVITNDRMCVMIYAEKHKDKESPRVEILVTNNVEQFKQSL
jgi:Holliday junction resolvase RusA-like endonuclease